MSDKLNKARQMLVDSYVASLEQNTIPWVQEWKDFDTPRNATNGRKYNGTNRLLLGFIAKEKGYKDPRWCTFTQIADKDEKYHPKEKWHLKKGSKGVPIEYWYIIDKETHKSLTFDEYRTLTDIDKGLEDKFILRCNTYTVFNAENIEGIKPFEPQERTDINRDEVLEKMIKNMKVDFEEKGSKAFYSPTHDKVTVPPIEYFKDDYSFHATAFHELAHATGHESRLNRNLEGGFGSPSYAKEELRAEISSSFFMQELKINFDEEHIRNHTAYIQDWISVLKKEPDELFRAIRDANEIADYMKDKAEIDKEITVDKAEKTIDKDEDFDIER